ncbi:MAG: DNA mismatch repair endonuclease MutL [Eubacteriales bacterium]|nr:DNA mismatch repair endonuclease MutL [Eubacteriales bacterium]
MSKIILLDENTANKIAAGEVVERPASIVKELLENSLDAGASVIDIEIKGGGIEYIRVTDNGSGIAQDDAEAAFERHSTSKIRCAEDLETVMTMGFRGEALASIAAVSDIELVTRQRGFDGGYRINIRGGSTVFAGAAGSSEGTSVTVRELFYNTPARYKFLKKDAYEAGAVVEAVISAALSSVSVSFRLRNNGAQVLFTPGNGDLRSTLYSLFGKEAATLSDDISHVYEGIEIGGIAGRPEIARSTRRNQYIFVNGRPIRNKTVTAAIDEAYRTILMTKKYAFIVLKLEISPSFVDVNVHPAKAEVRFSENGKIFEAVYAAIVKAVNKAQDIRAAGRTGDAEDSENPALKYNGSAGAVAEDILTQPGFTIYSGLSAAGNDAGSTEKACFGSLDHNTSAVDGAIEAGAKRPRISEMRVIGQLFATFILLEYVETAYMIDQHAAHERLLYEKLRKEYASDAMSSQMLLEPVTYDPPVKDSGFIDEKLDILNKAGFAAEHFGNNSYIIRSVPSAIAGEDPDNAFRDAVDALRGVFRDPDNNGYAENSQTGEMGTEIAAGTDLLLYGMACKAAIKGNRLLHPDEILHLLKDLDDYDGPLTCPHGRPLIMKADKKTFEKLFKRIL